MISKSCALVGFIPAIKEMLRDVVAFSEHASGITLRDYQRDVARAIVRSVRERAGRTFVIIFPRQSGKNELQAQIECYLLCVLSQYTGEIVKASPTWKPQSLNAMRRLERVLERNLIAGSLWEKESGYIYRVDKARIYFLSGSEKSNVVGATANELLECDEAQDVSPEKWDKDFAPMAASTNATKVFWGTAWTSRTLLARERQAAEKAQAADGIRRVWILDADDVAIEVPAYGLHVAGQVKKLGRNHPMIKTQYYSQEIDAEGGMFPPERIQLMRGTHPPISTPEPDQIYAMTIDIAGEDEGALGDESLSLMKNPGRDATSVTIFNVDLSTLPADSLGAPTYKVVARYSWVGQKHTSIFNQLTALAQNWRVLYIVVDSTGVGAGLASFLDKRFPGRVIPFLYTAKSKSDLGWGFLAVIETGRYKEATGERTLFWQQVQHCQSQVMEGPGRMMKWGVPDGTRDALSGELVHDDEIISSAMCSILDDQEWSIGGDPLIIDRVDPITEMDAEGF